jgi:hypothetical protein
MFRIFLRDPKKEGNKILRRSKRGAFNGKFEFVYEDKY